MPEEPNPFAADEASDLRRDIDVEVGTESRGKAYTDIPESKVISLSQSGCINRIVLREKTRRVFDCGHPLEHPFGGRCAEEGCNAISCQLCFARCEVCLKPVCLEHLQQVHEDSRVHRYCGRCQAETKRQRFRHTLIRTLLSPFIEEDHS